MALEGTPSEPTVYSMEDRGHAKKKHSHIGSQSFERGAKLPCHGLPKRPINLRRSHIADSENKRFC